MPDQPEPDPTGPRDGSPGPAPGAEGEPAPDRKRLRQRREELRSRTEATRSALEARAGDLRQRHRTVRVAFAAYERDRRHAGGLLAGGLAFRLFLWLLPAALVVVSVFALIADVASERPEDVARSAGLGAALGASVAQAAEASGRGRIWLLVLGIVLMLWAGIGLVKALRLLAGVAWQVRQGPLKHPVRATAICSVVAIGVAALPVLLGPLYAGGPLSDLAASLLAIAALTAILVWVMFALPHPDGVTWPRFLPGALLVAVGVEFVRIVTAVYFAPRLARTSDLYGALGLAAVFLAWLYLSGRLVVVGFALNAELWRAHEATAPGSPEGPHGDGVAG